MRERSGTDEYHPRSLCVNRGHKPEVCQQKAQWGSSNPTRGLDQSSKTKGNKRQWGKNILIIKNKPKFWILSVITALPGEGSLEWV